MSHRTTYRDSTRTAAAKDRARAYRQARRIKAAQHAKDSK